MTGRRGRPAEGVASSVRAVAATMSLALLVAGCGHSTAAPPVTTTIATTTTTSTTIPVASNLTVVGVRPGVNEPPFYPQVMVTKVSCGVAPQGGRYVRVDLPAGGAGTPAKSVLTQPTAVLIAPGGAVLVDPRYITRALYAESMKSVTTANQGAFVLTLHNYAATGADGLTVVVGNVQVNGDYECPDNDLAYPGT